MQKMTQFEHRVMHRLKHIERLLLALRKFERKGGKKMTKELDDLQTSVAHNTDVEESAITLIQGLAAQIAAAGTDPVALQALTDSLNAESEKLAAAVAANTPAQPSGHKHSKKEE